MARHGVPPAAGGRPSASPCTDAARSRRARGVAGALGVLDPAVLAGDAVEAVWLAAHVTTWPLGLCWAVAAARRSRPTASSTCRRSSAACSSPTSRRPGTPILLVHGIVSNRSIFTLLRRGLTRRGFSNVFAMNYLTLATDVRTAAAGLSEEVERIVEETGFERIHIIGHSLGGLIARYYVTRLGGDARVHTLVTLGTPHERHATPRTPCRPRLMQQMRPGQRADARARRGRCGAAGPGSSPTGPTTTSAILPQRSARPAPPRPARARNVRLHGAGHLTLPMLREVVHGISDALAHLDTHGGTVTAGRHPARSVTSEAAGTRDTPGVEATAHRVTRLTGVAATCRSDGWRRFPERLVHRFSGSRI